MASDAEPGAESETGPLTLDPDEQILLERNRTGPPLEVLPDEAFENLLIVTTGDTPGEVEATLRERDRQLRTVGVVPITSTLLAYEGPLWTTDRVAPGDLTGVSVRVSQGFPHLEAGRGWLVVDSISTLLMYAEEDRVYRLFDWLVGSARGEDISGVYTLQPDVVTARTRRRFEGLFDGVRRA